MKYRVENMFVADPDPEGNICSKALTVYSRQSIEEFLKSDYLQEFLNNKCLFVEYKPASDEYTHEIDVTKVCAVVKEIMLESDNYLYVDIDILDRPELNAKINHIYMRGNGDVETINDHVFVKHYFLDKIIAED